MSQPIRADALERPHDSRWAPADPQEAEAVLKRHRRAIEREHSGYKDPTTGLFVLTAAYLIERGWCCERGCRHCPFVGA